MARGRNCYQDLFSINSQIDEEKSHVLYIPSLTECPPNDPFNDWTLIHNQIYYYNYDIIDAILNEYYDYDILDGLSDYYGNVIYDV